MVNRFKGFNAIDALDLSKGRHPEIEWHAEVRDYGWCLVLCGSVIVAGEQVRYVKRADVSRDEAVQRLMRECNGNVEAFLERWIPETADYLALELRSWTPERVAAAVARNRP